MPWWGCIALGVGSIVVVTLVYRHRHNPCVSFEGGSPEFVTTIFIIFGAASVCVGIFGYFFPKVLEVARVLAETADLLQNIGDTLISLVIQTVVSLIFLYEIVDKFLVKREKPDWVLVLVFLFFAAVCVINFAWIFGRNNFDEVFVEPIRHLYKLIFG